MAGRIIHVRWKPISKFQELGIKAFRAGVPEISFLGSRGSGKTDEMIAISEIHTQMNPGVAHTGFFRKSFPEARDLIYRLDALLGDSSSQNKQEKTWTFPCGGRVTLSNLSEPKHADKGQGGNKTLIMADEAGSYPTPYLLDKLRGSLRKTQSGIMPQFIIAANPGGPGHGWLKKRYIDPAPAMNELFELRLGDSEELSGIECVTIPSTLLDNPLTATPEYIRQLKMSGNAELVRAWLYNDWYINAGAYYGGIFDRGTHVIEPFPIPDHWQRWRAMDWGMREPFCVLYGAIDDRGNIFVFDEIYGANKHRESEGLGWDAGRVAEHVRNYESRMHWFNDVDENQWSFSVGDLPGDVGSSTTVDEEFREYGIDWDRPSKTKNYRLETLQELAVRMNRAKADKLPSNGLFFFSNCKFTIDQVANIPSNELHLEDTDPKVPDHALDALRMLCDQYRDRSDRAPAPKTPEGYNPYIEELAGRRIILPQPGTRDWDMNQRRDRYG